MLPEAFVEWSAADKSEHIWRELVVGTAYPPTELPDIALPVGRELVAGVRHVVSPRLLRRTMRDEGDELRDRPKVIHTRGSVARIDWQPASRGWTGAFATPMTGLLRMSLAAPPTRKKAFIPGIGVKLFVDARNSLDVVAVNHTNGQGRNHDLFANELTHDLTGKHDESRLAQRLMAALFRRVTTEPRRLSIDAFSRWNVDGSEVTEPAGPTRIDFVPAAEVRGQFDGRAGEDFRRVLGDIDAGTALYDVVDENGATVATIRSASRFVASAGGDRLFFRHDPVAGDLRS